jgi:uncharacterized protein
MNQRNLIYKGYQGKEALYDLFTTDEANDKPLLVFVHGYMGYKDWGAWNAMCQYWLDAGYSSAKLNLSRNGTKIICPTEFSDLDAFGKSSYWSELQDIQLFLDHLEQTHGYTSFILVGHSRGGGLVLLAGKDTRAKQVHCLAPISSIDYRFPKDDALQQWKNDGVYFRTNGRTKQDMPHYYSQYEEFLQHKDELSIEESCKQLNKPVFVYHGENDTSVKPFEGQEVALMCRGFFFLIADTEHTFGAVEPWIQENLPEKMQEVMQLMMNNIHPKKFN